MVSSCRGAIASLQELLEGKSPKPIAELLTAHRLGPFPGPKEIS